MKVYQAHWFDASDQIDGDITKSPWNEVAWSEDFVDIEGDIRPKPRFRTRMKMFWSRHGLHIAAEMEEPHLWATLTEHDSVIFHDNDFEVFIDPDSDGYAYGELEINALNTTWDLLLIRPYREKGRGVDGWEIQGLKSAVKLFGTLNDPSDKDQGWTLEILIPWHSMEEISMKDSPPKNGDRWKINFSRVQWQPEIVEGKYIKPKGQKEDNWVWSPMGVVDMHLPKIWGEVEFVNSPQN